MHWKKDDGAESMPSKRKRGRRQGVENQRQTCKALSRSGAGSDMSGCVPEQLAPERGPASLRSEHPVTRQERVASGYQGSQGPANENNNKGREALATGMDLVGVAKELLALTVFSKVRSSICGRQAKAAFWGPQADGFSG